jgi:D-beta-D-heptose 7-phosphate kinase / D-beta-D-heptose 1-phosphate adenosyltransferase
MSKIDFSSSRVAIIGDLILDKYVDGSVDRVSPEAPVAVLLHRNERVAMGGAANVAANIATLGASVRLFGVIGEDDNGRLLLEQLRCLGLVNVDGVVSDKTRPTTCKTRVMSARHQLLRIDLESRACLTDSEQTDLLNSFEQAINWANAIVISDYSKGLCSDRIIGAVLRLGLRYGVPTVVDPKRRDFVVYRGARFITPNRKELTDATGLPCESDEDAQAAAKKAIEETGASILLTRSERGMSFFEEGAEPLHLPTSAREVFDVSGAGDTAVALFALGVASRLPMSETIRLANIGAGVVVGKVGTAVVHKSELEAILDAEAHHGEHRKGALVDPKEAVRLRERWKAQGLRVGFANGCFDLLHPGHISLLRQAAAACDRLIVGLNGDESVRRLKGKGRPIQDEASRAVVLGAMEAVDLVVLFHEETPADLIAALVPDVLVKGADYRKEDVVGADIVEAAGGRVILADLTPGQSTTSMIERAELLERK